MSSESTPTGDQNASATYLGFLLVGNGLATTEQVFPNGAPSTPTDLYRVPSKPIGRQTQWYNPASWFRRSGTTNRGQQTTAVPTPSTTSNMKNNRTVNDSHTVKSDATTRTVDTEPAPNTATTDVSTSSSTITPPAVAQTTETTAAPARAVAPPPPAAPAVQPKLPMLDQRPLTVAEVDGLEATVRAERRQILQHEETVHNGLNAIERTRLTFLVPAALQCEEPVVKVQQCYEKMEKQRLAAERGRWGATYRHVDVLACGPVVDELRVCVDTVLLSTESK